MVAYKATNLVADEFMALEYSRVRSPNKKTASVPYAGGNFLFNSLRNRPPEQSHLTILAMPFSAMPPEAREILEIRPMSRRILMMGVGLALVWISSSALAQTPGLESLGNLFGGGGADAARAAAGAAAGATDAGTAATDAAPNAVDSVKNRKKALEQARESLKQSKSLKGKSLSTKSLKANLLKGKGASGKEAPAQAAESAKSPGGEVH